jgi:hypothetical protein
MKRSSRFSIPVIAVGLSLLSLPALAWDDHGGRFDRRGGHQDWGQHYGPPGHAYGWHGHAGRPTYVYAPRYYNAAPRYYSAPRIYSAPAYYAAPAAYDVGPQVSLSFSLSAPLH